jgi:hypothetical protein
VLGGDPKKVFAVFAVGHRASETFELRLVDETQFERDLFRTGNAQALPPLQRAHELRCFEQAVAGPGVEPCEAAPHELEVRLAAVGIGPDDVGDLVFVAPGRLDRRRDLRRLPVEEIQAGQRPVRAWRARLLLDRQDFSLVVEFHHAVLLGIADAIAEHRCTAPA